MWRPPDSFEGLEHRSGPFAFVLALGTFSPGRSSNRAMEDGDADLGEIAR